ncbi:MAG: sulfotransferase [Burkholderiaceae bacterium]|nr:sulfotransferase [Roseateles sp.]MBV8468917.1 sulfotransferase [Burkholderiaceae bacterium]
MKPRFVGVAGLPRSGSTLLCQLLAEHPDVYCEGHSSPLCNSLLTLRRGISDDPFMLAQLDSQFTTSYGHLKTGMQGLLRGWYADQMDAGVVVDKSRGWLQCLDLLLELAPEARLLVPIRELGQIYGSIESQHQKTVLLDFIDHFADLDRFNRADQLFAPSKAVGAPLQSILAVQDFPQSIKDRLYFVKFEDLSLHPQDTMEKLYQWLGLSAHSVDPDRLNVRPHESDSYYRHKFLHAQRDRVIVPARHDVPLRVQELIHKAFAWYYDWFYPEFRRP